MEWMPEIDKKEWLCDFKQLSSIDSQLREVNNEERKKFYTDNFFIEKVSESRNKNSTKKLLELQDFFE